MRLPKPIASDPNRGGIGIRQDIRGLQWSNPDAEDCIFWIYKMTNIGEQNLDRTIFGLNVGASMGALVAAHTDAWDDCATFYRDISLTVNYDYGANVPGGGGIGTYGYSPVPWAGFAFLESPGNHYDGIDNDGDGFGHNSGVVIDTTFFTRIYTVGDPIVLIDYNSKDYDRTITTMPAQGISFSFRKQFYQMKPDSLLVEIDRNGVDDNLNGLIDESDGAELTETGERYFLYISDPVYNKKDYLAVDYINNIGIDNPMIDERRDDKIDNDND